MCLMFLRRRLRVLTIKSALGLLLPRVGGPAAHNVRPGSPAWLWSVLVPRRRRSKKPRIGGRGRRWLSRHRRRRER
jgi:hypothetical protein